MSPTGVALDDQNATVNAVVPSAVSNPALFGVVNMLYRPGEAADVALGDCAYSEYEQNVSPSTSAFKGRAGTAVIHVITPAAAAGGGGYEIPFESPGVTPATTPPKRHLPGPQ